MKVLCTGKSMYSKLDSKNKSGFAMKSLHLTFSKLRIEFADREIPDIPQLANGNDEISFARLRNVYRNFLMDGIKPKDHFDWWRLHCWMDDMLEEDSDNHKHINRIKYGLNFLRESGYFASLHGRNLILEHFESRHKEYTIKALEGHRPSLQLEPEVRCRFMLKALRIGLIIDLALCSFRISDPEGVRIYTEKHWKPVPLIMPCSPTWQTDYGRRLDVVDIVPSDIVKFNEKFKALYERFCRLPNMPDVPPPYVEMTLGSSLGYLEEERIFGVVSYL